MTNNKIPKVGESNIPEKDVCGIVNNVGKQQKKHPIQPVVLTESGIPRFKENKIVSYLLDKTTKTKICDLNDIAIFVANGTFSNEDQEQLAQLIGYSVGGAADLSYMSDEVIDEANRQAESLMNKDQVKEEKQSEEEKGEAATCVYKKTQYECPKHGEHEIFLQSKIINKEGVWCNICILEKLDELGINRMTEIKKLEEKK